MDRISGVGRAGVAAVVCALALLGASPAATAAPPPPPSTVAPQVAPDVHQAPSTPARADRHGGDSPSDAPTSARTQTTVGALAAGGTTLAVDEARQQARLRVDDGGTLDQYLYGPGPITFDIDLQGFSVLPAGGQVPQLSMEVFDVDQAGAEDCGPEVDQVRVNGVAVGTLTGANDFWSVNTFPLLVGTLTPGVNHFSVDIDTAGTGCWAVEVAWAEVSVPFAVGHVSSDATDDVTIRRGKSTDLIPDRVFERAFDTSGRLTAPTKDDPIADAMSDTHWFSSPTAGQLTYGWTVDAWPVKPTWDPSVEVSWSFSAGGGSGSAPATTGWTGTAKIPLPSTTGKYELTVSVKISKDTTLLTTQERKETVYVLLGTPVSSWVAKSPGASASSTDTPKTAWLDVAFELGASGRSAPRDVLVALNAGIYGNRLGLVYVGATWDTPEALIEGSGHRGQCTHFADVWLILARSVGVNVSTGSYTGTEFATTTRPALDANAGANVAATPGGTGERWFFANHHWGTYGAERFDPTFGVVGPDTAADFELTSMLCKRTGLTAAGEIICASTTTSDTYLLTSLGTTNAQRWNQYSYTRATTPPVPVSPLPFGLPFRAGPAQADEADALTATPSAQAPLAAVVPVTDAGEDPDGDGRFDRLRVDVPIDVTVGGNHVVMLELGASDGTLLASGSLDPASGDAANVTVALTPGSHTVPVWFDGRGIDADGPFRVAGVVKAPDGTVLATVDHRTQAYAATAFETHPAIGSVTDEVVGDQLRVHVPVTPSGAGPVAVSVVLSAGGTQVGAASQLVSLTTGTSDVALDVPTGPIWSSGLDGPYDAFISVEDAVSSTSRTHRTAAYDADALTPPTVRVEPVLTDTGVDADGDGRFETLDVTAQVVAATVGPVDVDATLTAADGTALGTAHATATGGPVPTSVTLHLDGRTIALAGIDGPYEVAVTASDASSGPRVARLHRTAPYTSAQFASPVARLTGAYTDAAVDTNADTHPDVLRLTVGVELDRDAEVTLSGTLVDATGLLVGTATTSATLLAGTTTLALDVDGGAIADSGRDGPYRLTDLELGPTGGPPEVRALGVHTTAAYDSATFRSSGPIVVGEVTDRGVDDDGDGLFDALAVDVSVHVDTPDVYSLNARLTDAAGTEIQWNGTQELLEAGDHVLTLRYDGRLISAHGVDGPYRVASISLYSDPAQPVVLRDAHLTAPYTWSAFELGAAVTGHVMSDGAPLVGAPLAVPGFAYTVTDANGAYRLGLTGGGTYDVVLAADPALAPWRILVDGTPVDPGTSVQVDVADGSTRTVDFERGGVVPTAAAFRPLPPAVLVDTRTGEGAPQGRVGARGIDVAIAGLGGVPTTGVAAVALRVQALDPKYSGSVMVRPGDGPSPLDPQVAFGRRSASGLAIVPLGADGSVHVSARGRPHIVVAAVGWFPADPTAPSYVPVTPTRLVDAFACPLYRKAPYSTDIPVAGHGGVPSTGVGAVVLSATVKRPWSSGSLSLHATSETSPPVPALTYARFRPASATVVVPLDADGNVRATVAGGPVRYSLSVVGWLPAEAWHAVTPTVVADTATSLDVQVTGVAGVPSTGVGAVALQVLSRTVRGGAVTLYPTGAPAPEVADVLVPRRGTATGLVLLEPAADGTVHVALDGASAKVTVVGWVPEH
ncbi:hypothetical protein [Cellulomonas sp.]|uniref:hypothetical protein n=1 Tax=Cellulomonas sp. TaxID=40001 RepID=UPI003BAB1A5E